jgi:hypothetical protein
VNTAALTITATNRSKTYGTTYTPDTTDPSPDFSASGLLNSDTVASITLASAGYVNTATVAGSPYTITPSGATGTGLTNYTISYVNGSLTVNTAALTITATNRSKTYGTTYTPDTTDPSLDFTVSGLVNSDTVASITLSSGGYVATATVAGSPYTITPSGATGTGLSNYAVSYVNGSFTVNPAGLTITATNRSKVFGVTYTPVTTNPSPDFTITGTIYGGDSVTSITLTCAGYAAGATVAGSPYTITPSAAVGTGLGNYAITYAPGSFTVNTWTITGFYQPVDMNGVINTIKGGSTVPLKFNIYAGNVERTSVSDVQGGTCQLFETNCSGGPEDPMGDLPNTGATALRYDTTGHQFIQNWATPKGANHCYVVRMTAIDGSVITAYFKTK